MEQILTRQEASDAVSEFGWRFLLRTIRTSVQVSSVAQAADLAVRAVATCGEDADQHLRIDVRPDRVILVLQSVIHATVTTLDVELANKISAATAEAGLRTEPEIGTEARQVVRSERGQEIRARPGEGLLGGRLELEDPGAQHVVSCHTSPDARRHGTEILTDDDRTGVEESLRHDAVGRRRRHVAQRHRSLTRGMTLPVFGEQDAFQVGVPVKHDAEHVKDFALQPVRRGPEVDG